MQTTFMETSVEADMEDFADVSSTWKLPWSVRAAPTQRWTEAAPQEASAEAIEASVGATGASVEAMEASTERNSSACTSRKPSVVATCTSLCKTFKVLRHPLPALTPRARKLQRVERNPSKLPWSP